MTFTPIPENSGATPGLFNTRFAEMDATISAATTSLLNTISTATGVVSSAVSTSYLQASATSLGPSTVTITGDALVSSALTVAGRLNVMQASLSASTSTLNLAQGRLVSVRTLAASALTVSAGNTNVIANEMVFTIGGASGASLAIHSGGTVYIFNSAISAKAT